MRPMQGFADRLPAPPQRRGDFDDMFADGLRPDRWTPHYLPHWTTPDRSGARYRITPQGIELRIEEDQLDWRPEDAPLRVSNLQTGTFSGPIGSTQGTHRHRPDGLVVRTNTPQQLLWAPTQGRIDLTVTASRDEGCMTAAWLVGTEHLRDEDCGEICIFEIDAQPIGPTTTARSGLKAHHDPRLTSDMTEVTLPFNAGTTHTWTVIWGGGETVIGCEGVRLRTIHQAPTYPLFLMVDLFEVAAPSGAYPKSAIIHRIAGWDFN